MALFKKRSALRTGKLAKKRRRLLYVKLAAIAVLLIMALGGSAYGLSRPEVLIHEIAISGNKALAEHDVLSLIEEELDGRYFFTIPKRSVLLYPHDRIEASALEAFKRIEEIDISRDGLQAIAVSIEEREPFAVWCEQARSEDVASTSEQSARGSFESCYFLDDGGYIFTEAPRFTGNVYFRYYGPIGGGEPVGSQYLDENVFQQLTFFLEAIEELDVTAVSLSAGENDYELVLGNGAGVYFGRDQELGAVLNNLESILSSDVFKEKGLAGLEYIDLRFGNKVFYKYEDGL